MQCRNWWPLRIMERSLGGPRSAQEERAAASADVKAIKRAPRRPQRRNSLPGLAHLKSTLIRQAQLEVKAPEEARAKDWKWRNLNIKIGAFEETAQKITSRIFDAESEGTDVLFFQETGLTGYPAQDAWGSSGSG